MYVKEDLVLPHNISFYDLIISKARGKSGPLFHFDVYDDVRMEHNANIEKEESHAGEPAWCVIKLGFTTIWVANCMPFSLQSHANKCVSLVRMRVACSCLLSINAVEAICIADWTGQAEHHHVDTVNIVPCHQLSS